LEGETVLTHLQEAVAQVFAQQGALSLAEPAFTPRQARPAWRWRWLRAIEEGGVLVVEAGTGVGKTYAYLVPALLSGQRVLVSTATKALQDQLFAVIFRAWFMVWACLCAWPGSRGALPIYVLERLERVRKGRTAPQDPQVLRAVADVGAGPGSRVPVLPS
jgi:ATP-dependent DNA helicase DinG